MDEFPGLLARDFGFRPQGKSAPMAASKGTGSLGSGGTLNFGIGSGGDIRSSSFTSRSKSGWNSNSVGGSFLDDHDGLFRPSGNQKTQDSGGLGGYDDVFGGPPKYTNRSDSRGGASSASTFDYDSIFQGSKDSGSKSSSLPVFDKPVYDDDMFNGLPGTKSSSSVKYDDVFSSMSSPPKQTAFDDLLGNLTGKEPEFKSSSGKRSGKVEKDLPGFDDLIPGFGGSSPSNNRGTSKASQRQQSTVPSSKSTASMMEDPFVVLESTSTTAYSSSDMFTDPLEHMSKTSNSGSTKIDPSIGRGVFDDMDPLNGLGKSVPSFSSEMNNVANDKIPIKTGSNMTARHTSAGKEPTEKPSAKVSNNTSQKKVSVDNYQDSHQTLFDMPTASSDSQKPSSHSSHVHTNSNDKSQVDMSPRSEENMEAADDIWLTVSEVPLFTQPTSAPPPSRPPPPRPAQASKTDRGSFTAVNTKKKVNESYFPNSAQNFQSNVPDSVKNQGVSSIDELEDFAMGRPRSNADENVDVFSSEEDMERNSAAAAMKEAVDRAEAKFKHAREVRERGFAKARSREAAHLEKDEAYEREQREREEKERELRDREREQKEREEKEREQRRLERERERQREIERAAVLRAQAEARERAAAEARERAEKAAAEARLKAERAAVEKANQEARGRAERAAVQRAQAEARERAAVEARERAEKAAIARAEAEARVRAERAAVERASAEARERAAAAAAAAAARENQQKNGNDLESFFSMSARANSAPRPRPTTSDPVFDTQFQNKGGPDGTRKTSFTSSSMRKASSTTNIVDDLTSIFGGSPSSGEFQEIEGESEERRKARWERHQRTQERAAKALAEKNQRDLQTQREQAERHRIAETLDVEIKRWAAGKEGNLRALLSTLQYVLWPECGWQPVSLTDLITSASVKKVYRKATLCIHPDKVQQKGANLQQKYIAEKVFDLLKEAWNKFNSEELF
ncbi:PREDICTED: auxilin-related protein 2-like [Nelumbo nucifera]|uniref:Auxilin-related protein 2-like n=1 Tax=Nelumbo nucifera TaxID=4432 RepID=A0A1U8B3J3_NELNU|nr:PREDICTED: auxilin-related protein 2-like [Nelumbo nucifera]